jgi:hypothetical protein
LIFLIEKIKAMRSTGFRFLILASVISRMITIPAFAQLNIDAQFRPRFEIRDGYQKLASTGSSPAIFISQRTRLGFDYKSDFLTLRFTPQDIRIWGDEQVSNPTGVFGDHASLELFEAYAGIRLGQSAIVNIGRQQLIYDNEWLLSARNWNQQGIAYDAAVLKLAFPGLLADIGISWNTVTSALSDNFYPPDRIKSLNYIWSKIKVTGDWNLSLVQMATGYTEDQQSNTLNFRHTSGFYSEYNLPGFSINSNLYYQYGKNQQGREVSALLAASDVSYRIGKLAPGLGVSYLSGNSKAGEPAARDRLFNMFYGARHKYFGFMDYFRNMFADTSDGGLVDYHVNLSYSVSESLVFRNCTHYFTLDKINLLTPGSKILGWENDFIARYRFQEWGALEAGYCLFQPRQALMTIQGVDDSKFSQFFYLQLTIIQGFIKNDQL